MKVLVAHNRYRSDVPSGENKIVDAEIQLLRDNGVDVVPMIEESDSIPSGIRGVAKAAPGPIYSHSGVTRFKRLLREHRPDVVHLHNVFPLISPWVIRVANDARVPVVQTVHNYRHSCVNGLHFRDGHPCVDCVGTRFQTPGVRYACYQGSRLRTLPMTLSQNVHSDTWRKGITRFLALTPFMRDRLALAGVDRRKISIRPTWVPGPGQATPLPKNGDVLFIGRLDEYKGVRLLLEAWASRGRDSGRRLRIAGEGALASLVRQHALTDPSIQFDGHLGADEIVGAIARSAFVVMPSLLFEGFPLVVAEAFACGRPVLAVSGGSVATILDQHSGWVTEPTPDALAMTLCEITDGQASEAGRRARQRYEAENSPAAAFESLTLIYRELVL